MPSYREVLCREKLGVWSDSCHGHYHPPPPPFFPLLNFSLARLKLRSEKFQSLSRAYAFKYMENLEDQN